MRKTAAILALCLGLILVGNSFFMTREDAKNVPQRITDAFDAIGDQAYLDHMERETDRRNSEERTYGLAGAAFIIAGLAIWPRKGVTAPVPAAPVHPDTAPPAPAQTLHAAQSSADRSA
jgi:hypothetical protein